MSVNLHTPSETTAPAMLFPYVLDTFQQDAIQHIEDDHNVLVTAHTSAGKSTVAEYAIAKCAQLNKRAIYTSPIKTLSNQKFADFRVKATQMGLRPEDIGIMTGDIKLNPEGQCVIMTTEILRNMLFKGNEFLDSVQMVIFDEVHYLNDPDRGHVWEESIVMLPPHINLIMLSATISGSDRLAQWIERLKNKPTPLISTLTRPVPLHHYLFYQDEIHHLMDSHGHFEFAQYDQVTRQVQQDKRRGLTTSPHHKLTSLVKFLHQHQLGPTILFSFSRKNCHKYAEWIQDTLIDHNIRSHIETTIETNVHKLLSPENHHLPQIESLRALASRGIAVHHSGLLPAVKEIVEVLFEKGWIRLLFATETFAVGVNMPARSVVFTDLEKPTGQSGQGLHLRNIRTDEYLQMSGRAGRRGLDTKGTVIYAPLRNMLRKHEVQTIMGGSTPSIESKLIISSQFVLQAIASKHQDMNALVDNSLYQQETLEMIQRNFDTYQNYQEQLKKLEDYLHTQEQYDVIEEFVTLQQEISDTSQQKIRKKKSKNLQKIKKKWLDERFLHWDMLIQKEKQRRKLLYTLSQVTDGRDQLLHDTHQQVHRMISFLSHCGYVSVTLTVPSDLTSDNVMDQPQSLEEWNFLQGTHLARKGLMACDIHECHPLLLTEAIERDYLTHLTPLELVAVLASFVESREEITMTQLASLISSEESSSSIMTALHRLQDIWQELDQCASQYGLSGSEIPEDSFQVGFVPIAYAWAQGKSFMEIKENISGAEELYEGNFIRNILKIQHICREMQDVFEIMNNVECLPHLAQVEPLIIRDLVCTNSLYLSSPLATSTPQRTAD